MVISRIPRSLITNVETLCCEQSKQYRSIIEIQSSIVFSHGLVDHGYDMLNGEYVVITESNQLSHLVLISTCNIFHLWNALFSVMFQVLVQECQVCLRSSLKGPTGKMGLLDRPEDAFTITGPNHCLPCPRAKGKQHVVGARALSYKENA